MIHKICSSSIQYSRKIGRHFLESHSPEFMIIGAQKCGTSSLHFYLNQHPDLCGSVPKEVCYFNRDIHFGKKLYEYENHFKSRSALKFFESTPEYLYQPGVAGNIKSSYPQCKFIVLLRDPVKRAFSAWNHYRLMFENNRFPELKNRCQGNLLYEKYFSDRRTFPGFRECIDIELDMIEAGEGFEPSLLRRGLYYEQLTNYWKKFDRGSLLILGFSDFMSNKEKVLNEICTFLGVDEINWMNQDTKTIKNPGNYTESIDSDVLKYLEEYYRVHNEMLFAQIGEIKW